jgi:hypothetical protein
MSRLIKTILRFVWFFILLALVVGFSGWVLLAIPVAGSFNSPSSPPRRLPGNWLPRRFCFVHFGAVLPHPRWRRSVKLQAGCGQS